MEYGIGYDASTLASLNAFPFRIISAQPYTKIAIFHPLQSDRLSGFVFYGVGQGLHKTKHHKNKTDDFFKSSALQ
ncbi:MAG: hypothetical protein IKJ20_05510 [Alistipes sp.]|nr:hypothetical protein [Alistipes sp.]